VSFNGSNHWKLEVVRGRDVGRIFAVEPASCVLGNSLDGQSGVDLAEQEGASSRRMASRHAQLQSGPAGLYVRDLDSPGGTFVNRQRVLPGQDRRLAPGDVIQLGSVQLRVVPAENGSQDKSILGEAARPLPTPAGAGALPSPFFVTSSLACRSWNDFLTVSSRDWPALREALASGRLATFLRSINRDELQPSTDSSTCPDERLDAWLCRIPTTRDAKPDLEVHPLVIRLRALPGGGTMRSKIVVTNTGYRLLRSTIRVEPADVKWLEISARYLGQPFTTAEETEIPLEVLVPESVGEPLIGGLTVESNGGSRRVEVRVEPAARAETFQSPPPETRDYIPGPFDRLAAFPLWQRLIAGAVGAFLLRLLLLTGDALSTAAHFNGGARPFLPGSAVLIGCIGGLLGAWFAARRDARRDAGSAALAGSIAGVLAAAVSVAACRTIESLVGPTSWIVSGLAWEALCVLFAAGPMFPWLVFQQIRRAR
jgi:pSer/pThr/pTyr-binding forkhead associated (FHA) protein